MASVRDILINFISSGKHDDFKDPLTMDDLIRHISVNTMLSVGVVVLTVFGISRSLEGDIAQGLSDATVAIIFIMDIILLRTKLPFLVGGFISIGSYGILCASLVFGGALRGFATTWIYTFPMVSIFILGLQAGLILSIVVLCAILTATLIPGLAGFSYTPVIAARMAGSYILCLVITLVYEQSRLVKDRRLFRLAAELKAERDEITAMKDNLKTGVFLMDQDFTIQPAYSKAMEGILEMENLQGVQFTDLLASSLKLQERETLRDYFNMVINRSYDAKMLEEINPIAEFVYFNDNYETEKKVRTSFASVDRGHGEFYILGTVTDITAEVELQNQLAAETSKRDEEMRALFQVIKIEPRVFSDFIEDTEYEFDRINGILKDKALSAPQALIQIYQCVHAIKSNALILGLENFSEKLHELESGIKKVQDQEDIPFEDMLRLIIEIESVMREKDKFQETIEKLQSFQGGDSRRQDRHVLIETLTKACEKAAAAMDKKAQFIVGDLDGIILEHGPRRVIKEVLTQLVRNAVYHGIESPEERKLLGKDPEGHIRLSMKHGDNQIHVKLTDDGRGLDFDRIREKAEGLHLLPEGEEAAKNQLLQVIFAPGFSTADEANVHAGRGIGLNLVKERIRDLHGSIKLQTEPGKGTVFNIFIPLVIPAAVHKAS